MSSTASSKKAGMHQMEIHGNSVTLDFNIMSKEEALQVIAHWNVLGMLDSVTFSQWTDLLQK